MKYQVLFSLKNNENIFKTSRLSSAAVAIGALRFNIPTSRIALPFYRQPFAEPFCFSISQAEIELRIYT